MILDHRMEGPDAIPLKSGDTFLGLNEEDRRGDQRWAQKHAIAI